jgi:hypothetical protein
MSKNGSKGQHLRMSQTVWDRIVCMLRCHVDAVPVRLQACSWTGDCAIAGCADKCTANPHLASGMTISDLSFKRLMESFR